MDSELLRGGQWTDGEQINVTIEHFYGVLSFSALQHNEQLVDFISSS